MIPGMYIYIYSILIKTVILKKIWVYVASNQMPRHDLLGSPNRRAQHVIEGARAWLLRLGRTASHLARTRAWQGPEEGGPHLHAEDRSGPHVRSKTRPGHGREGAKCIAWQW